MDGGGVGGIAKRKHFFTYIYIYIYIYIIIIYSHHPEINPGIPKFRYLWMSSKFVILEIFLILFTTNLLSCGLYYWPNFVDLQLFP